MDGTDIKEKISEVTDKLIKNPWSILLLGIGGFAALIALGKKYDKEPNNEETLKQELKEQDAERFDALKNIEVDHEVFNTCKKLALSDVKGDEQNTKTKCKIMINHFENFENLSKQIKRDIKDMNAKRVVRKTVKRNQSRMKY